jgi:hypothetical protein
VRISDWVGPRNGGAQSTWDRRARAKIVDFFGPGAGGGRTKEGRPRGKAILAPGSRTAGFGGGRQGRPQSSRDGRWCTVLIRSNFLPYSSPNALAGLCQATKHVHLAIFAWSSTAEQQSATLLAAHAASCAAPKPGFDRRHSICSVAPPTAPGSARIEELAASA